MSATAWFFAILTALLLPAAIFVWGRAFFLARKLSRQKVIISIPIVCCYNSAVADEIDTALAKKKELRQRIESRELIRKTAAHGVG